MPGPGAGKGPRVNIAAISRRKAKDMGLDLESLVWDVMIAMLLQAQRGDTKAAKIVFDVLGEAPEKGPLINIDARKGMPEPPPVRAAPGGPPAFGEHLKRLNEIAEEFGLAAFAGELAKAKPVEVVDLVAEKRALDNLLS